MITKGDDKIKVYITIEDGIVNTVSSNKDVEVIVKESDSNGINSLKFMNNDIKEDQDLISDVYEDWKKSVENYLKYDEEVGVIPDGEYVFNGFCGRVMGPIEKDLDESGSYYVNVKDMDDNCYSVDILNIILINQM